jgi:tRNA pseudouridine65 synthase
VTPELLFQADSVLVVNKTSGQLVHNSSWAGRRERTLTGDVRAAFGDDYNPVHRLDRQASGCVLFARGRDATRGWQDALADDAAEKRYLALVRGRLSHAVLVDHPLKDADKEGADALRREARTHVRPLASSDVERCCLVEARPLTGRTHQVRRHLKHLSHPILGDANYGKGPLNRDYRARFGLARLALHCARLVLVDVHGTRVEAEAPLPADLLAPLERLFPEQSLQALLHELLSPRAPRSQVL